MMLKFWMICHEICEKIAAAFSLLRAGALSCGRALSLAGGRSLPGGTGDANAMTRATKPPT